jgi:DNA adenine methylase
MTYPGGKAGSGVYQTIINQIPPHEVYIEPFLGGGAVLLHKRPARSSIGIDADGDVITYWMDQIVASGDAYDWLTGVTVRQGDARNFLKSYDWQGGEFVYCDPPYLFDVRSCRRPIYTCEFGDVDQHWKLLDVLLSLSCRVAISGYWSSLYGEMLANWRTINFRTRTRGGRMATEWLWMNYSEPIRLHDYRYLGANFRERERIKRIKMRWSARLARMDRLERYAVLASIAGLDDPSCSDRAELD